MVDLLGLTTATITDRGSIMLMFTAHNFQQKQKPRDVFVLKQCLKFLYLVASLKGMSGFLQQVDYNLL